MIWDQKICMPLLAMSFFWLGLTPCWAEGLKYDDAWWANQYTKIYNKPHCQEIIPYMKGVREQDQRIDLLKAPRLWALGLYFEKGECADPDPDHALAILTDLAERGEGIPTVLLAHFHHVRNGANADVTQSWMQRAKNVMVRIVGEDWRKDFYQPRAETYKKMGIPFSPQLEQIFSWGEKILKGDPKHIYEYGVKLLDHGQNPEDKVLGCLWLYDAMHKGHVQARYRFARQMLLGEGILQVPSAAVGYLHSAVNRGHNIDAILFVSQLLEKGDVFKRDLSNAYIALLRAQKFGASVTDVDLSRLRKQLTKNELSWAEKDAADMKMSIFFSLTPELDALNRSGFTSSICRFLP